ncbi:hypothetical protein [Chryseobacterium limigenitum]|uniref:Uncharacterized protein n=1 Tax=Chryseobacterium limigenitum TaxID=1612149 RepID=A0A1K2ITD8_9FLAO|nr:hypothetical protein [Chryseobacterium limigenitum]SFZ95717.1 hypothetical protein SAMN05216324_11238 [Chryseobacterium limigenitum]
MITFFQEREIEKFLLEKKISGNLLAEIKDHMISQILELQCSKKHSFNEAFDKTKLNWGEDLILVRKNLFSRQKITKIAYEIDKAQNKKLIFKSILYVCGFTVLQILLAYSLDKRIYLNVFSIFLLSLALSPFLVLKMYIQQKRLQAKNKSVIINNYIHPIFAFFIAFSLNQFIDLPTNGLGVIYDYINFNSKTGITTEIFTAGMLNSIFLLTFLLISILSLKENIRRLKQAGKIYN